MKVVSSYFQTYSSKTYPLVALSLGFALSVGIATAQPIIVPGGSFESPAPFPGFPVNTSIDSWQETPQPIWFNPADFQGTTWDQLSGVFANTPVGSFDHINNMHGNQAMYMFAVPTVGIFQDYNSVDWNDGSPTHAFNSTFDIGKSYDLTIGILGGTGLAEGSLLRLSLYYRDGGNNLITVNATDVSFSSNAFPDINNFVDFSVTVPSVQAGDAWAGQNIGIAIEALTPGNSYWDVDNVRLVAVPEPSTLAMLGVGIGAILTARARRR